MKAAHDGDRSMLQARLADLERRGALSNADAADLAQVVAERDVSGASSSAVDTVGDARWCARVLDGALSRRMTTHDAAGAQAALVRLEAGELDPGDARSRLADPDPLWQAVGTRGLVRGQDRAARAAALLSPSQDVRLQAARASLVAADPADVDALSEAARLDPWPLVRTAAVRALTAMPASTSPRVSRVLRDLWTTGDDGLREDIAGGYAASPIWEAGGREALSFLLASERGPGVLEGAAAVLRRPDVDPALRQDALNALSEAIADGSPATRIQALMQAPVDAPSVRAAIDAASHDATLLVRVAALSRRVETDASRLAELEVLARPGSPVAAQARLALAEAGDKRIQLWLEDDLSARRPADRMLAALGLVSLGMAARAAPLLADESAGVRVRAACSIAMAARTAR